MPKPYFLLSKEEQDELQPKVDYSHDYFKIGRFDGYRRDGSIGQDLMRLIHTKKVGFDAKPNVLEKVEGRWVFPLLV